MAELEADKIYFAETLPVMGGMKARVYAAPLNPHVDLRIMKMVFKLMDKFPPTEFRPEFSHMQQEYSESTILRAKQKYEQGRKNIE